MRTETVAEYKVLNPPVVLMLTSAQDINDKKLKVVGFFVCLFCV